MSGINMYAMALILKVILGWNIYFSICISAVTVGIYVTLGGLYSAVFNEVMQFFLIWFGALLIPIFGLIDAGGWSGMVARIHQNFPVGDYTHVWQSIGSFYGNPMGIHWTGIVLGSGIRDFLRVLEHGLPGGSTRIDRQGSPLRQACPHYRFFFQDGSSLHSDSARTSGFGCPSRCHLVPESAITAGQHSYNEVLPIMLARYFGPGLLGLGITALMAGFMSGMAGEISAFTTVTTYDIYRSYINKNASDDTLR